MERTMWDYWLVVVTALVAWFIKRWYSARTARLQKEEDYFQGILWAGAAATFAGLICVGISYLPGAAPARLPTSTTENNLGALFEARDATEVQRRKEIMDRARRRVTGLPMTAEFVLFQSLLDNFSDSKYPFAIEAEWEFVPGLTHLGRGDLVFSSKKDVCYQTKHDPCRVLVVEVKNMHPGSGRTAQVSRTKARKKVRDQMRQAMYAWSQRHPNDEVYGAVYTNDFHHHIADPEFSDRYVGIGCLSMLR
jgi:hypothetical protein